MTNDHISYYSLTKVGDWGGSPRQFDAIVKMVRRREESGAVLAVKKGHLLPLVSIGPSGIGGEWQWEVE